jgi:hypothetical protein
MTTIMPADSLGQLRRFVRRYALLLFVVGMTVSMTAILSVDLGNGPGLSVEVGKPATSDVFAPQGLVFSSQLLTEEAREQARRSVGDIYSALDLSIGRNQLAQARTIFAYIDTVRADSSNPLERRVEYLQAIAEIAVNEALARTLLILTDADYERVKSDVYSIIEDLMREEIRPSQLSDFQRTARRLVSLELAPDQTAAVTELAYQFITPTVFPDEDATEQAREAAAAAIAPVMRSVSAEQRILRAGDLVTEADYELLGELGLLKQASRWPFVASMAMLSVLVAGLITLYWARFQAQRFPNTRYLAMLAILMLLFTLAARIMMGSEALAYWYPLAALSIVLAVVYDIRFAVLVTMLMAGLAGFVRPNSLELAAYLAAGGVLSALTLHDPQRVTAIFRAGLLAALGYGFVGLMFWLSHQADLDTPPLSLAYGLGNGILSSGLALAGFYILGGLFGIVTLVQLQDLSRLDHVLLRDLLRRAPGTYHHSIMVANLAEQAAERIGADSTLVRVGAFYHDIGKIARPAYFIENQEGVDPHESLDPMTSARIILGHVSEGLALAHKERLPIRIQDIIAEHHGTRVVKVFYRKAQELAGEAGAELDKRPFQYPGPQPQTRESGIVMLADAIDAASTALRPNTEKAIEKLVTSLIEEDMLDGQLEHSGLTLGDLQQLRLSFIETLKGRYHVRVQYPGNGDLLDEPAPAAPATPLREPVRARSRRLAAPRQSSAPR